MQIFYITFLAASAALARARSHNGEDPREQHLAHVCTPTNSSGFADFNAPCNAIEIIELECVYGSSYLATVSTLGQSRKRQSTGSDGQPPMQSNETQRICLCESQFWVAAKGCWDCYTAHGGDGDQEMGGVSIEAVSSLSASYCAATATPSQGIFDVFLSFGSTVTSSPAPSSTSSYHDPIGNKTEVSFYYTPSVTGSAAWLVYSQTGTSAISYTTTNIVNGQIAATGTAGANEQGSPTASGSSGSASGSGNSLRRHDAVAKGAAGLFVLGGVVAML